MMLRAPALIAPPSEAIERWIYDRVRGKSFVDIGGIGLSSDNERTSIAARSGAVVCKQADIRPISYWEWDNFRKVSAKKGVFGVDEYDLIDIRKRDTLKVLGACDVVHSTGILYHLPSPAEALWNLRTVTNQYLITNTVCIPRLIRNEFGSISMPDSGVLFGAGLTTMERAVLNKYYFDKFGFTVDTTAPRLDDLQADHPWIQDDELTCWPYWYFYTEHAFKSLLNLCRFEVLETAWFEDHVLFVLCKPIR